MLMLVMMIMMIVISQMTSGPIKFIHMHETCVDSAAGFATLIFCFINPGVAVLSEKLIEVIGTQGMFSFFAICSTLGFLYYIVFMKDTVYTTITV